MNKMIVEKMKSDRRLVYLVTAGSRGRDLASPNSDMDLRGVFVTPVDMEWQLEKLPDMYEEKPDTLLIEVRRFVRSIAVKGTEDLETLFVSPEHIHHITLAGKFLRLFREKFVSIQLLIHHMNAAGWHSVDLVEKAFQEKSYGELKNSLLARALSSYDKYLREEKDNVARQAHYDEYRKSFSDAIRRLMVVEHALKTKVEDYDFEEGVPYKWYGRILDREDGVILTTFEKADRDFLFQLKYGDMPVDDAIFFRNKLFSNIISRHGNDLSCSTHLRQKSNDYWTNMLLKEIKNIML
jgi:predicted nucleotidyltransferase